MRLICILNFLENCLFLDLNVQKSLKDVLILILTQMERKSQDFDFDEKIPGLKDYWDL
jgi:hypothetical protein